MLQAYTQPVFFYARGKRGHEMTKTITGGCKCGRVRYSGEKADASMFRCHCRDCQQLTGAGHSSMIPLVKESFALSETCSIFQMTGRSGGATYSGFCPNCGSQLMRRSDKMRDLVYVHAASLDDPTAYRREATYHADAAQAWDPAFERSKT